MASATTAPWVPEIGLSLLLGLGPYVRRVDIVTAAFAIAALVSLLLVSGYLWRVAGAGFGRLAAAAQFAQNIDESRVILGAPVEPCIDVPAVEADVSILAAGPGFEILNLPRNHLQSLDAASRKDFFIEMCLIEQR